MNNRKHRDSEGAEKGIKDKEKGRRGDFLCRLGETERTQQFELAKNPLWVRYATRILKKLVFDLLLTMDVKGKNSCYNDRCNCDGRYDFHVSSPYPVPFCDLGS